MASPARKVFGAFEKRAPDPADPCRAWQPCSVTRVKSFVFARLNSFQTFLLLDWSAKIFCFYTKQQQKAQCMSFVFLNRRGICRSFILNFASEGNREN